MNKRFKVISIHYTTECDMKPRCPFCYRNKETDKRKEKSLTFWYKLVPYLSELTEQVACLPPDEKVFVYNEKSLKLQEIKDIKVGDYIIGNSQICCVKNIIKKKTEEKMYLIKLVGGRMIRLTENHLIPTKRGLLKVKELLIGDELMINKEINVEEIKEIDLEKYFLDNSIKYRLKDDRIILERHGYSYPRKIKVNNQFARLCGYYVSEGFKRGFAFNKDENLIMEEVIKDFKEVLQIDLKRRNNGENGICLENTKGFVGDLIFNKVMCLGSGARNKGIGKVFSFDKENILQFLRGLFNGDGCLRAKEQRGLPSISLSYKTASRRLAEELRLLLEGRLGIVCSYYEGISPKRKIENREIEPTNYFTIEIYGKKNMSVLIEKLNLMKRYDKFIKLYNQIGNRKYSNKKFISENIVIKEINELNFDGNVFDIQVKNNLFTINGNVIVHNCGGGEPFTNLEFMEKFSKKCKNKGLLCNATTNGRLLMNLTDRQLKDILKNITMVSISYDSYKVKNLTDLINYIKLVKRIKKLTKTQIGSNLLIDENMFKDNGLTFIKIVDNLFKMGCNRVFALCPKNINCPDILKHKKAYIYLTLKFKHFFVDDLTKCILEQGKYTDWCKKCHYFQDIISINEQGFITGCSFDSEDKALLKLDKPKDILKIINVRGEERFTCPYLKNENKTK